MAKILSLSKLLKELLRIRNDKKVGLVTGCFDILHAGHIDLFRFAKSHVDILIVGLDTDESIKATKGQNRPINTLKDRCKLLSEITLIDYIFPLATKARHASKEANDYYDQVAVKLHPHYIITGTYADSAVKIKENRAKKAGGRLLKDRRRRTNSTTNLINKLTDL